MIKLIIKFAILFLLLENLNPINLFLLKIMIFINYQLRFFSKLPSIDKFSAIFRVKECV